MSKKKSFSGSTMTLKDFHGGSIPSDLPLPSAPGVSVRQPDRIGPIGGGWGAAGIGGRMPVDHYRPSRPGSAGGGGGGGGARGFGDEVAPFLPHSARIGRNFEEDERKPFDASAAPRRVLPTAAVEIDRVSRSATDVPQLQPPQPQMYQTFGRPESSPAAPHLVSGGSHFPAAGVGAQWYGNGNPAVPNAWGIRKEVVSEPQVQATTTWSGPAAASRFAQASAIEKISSGRWQSKHAVCSQSPNAEIIRFSEVDEGINGFQDHGIAYGGSSEQRFVETVGGLERKYNERIDEHQGYQRSMSLVHPEVKERNGVLGFGTDRNRPQSSEGRHGGAFVHQQDGRLRGQQSHQLEGRFSGLQVSQQGGRFSGPQVFQHEETFNGQLVADTMERPKLRLLPRTKPLEASETTKQLEAYEAQGHQIPSVDIANVESLNDIFENRQPLKPPGSSGSEGDTRMVERPRLNLKPRSQPLEQSAAGIEKERKTLFGGARPRELVLKERGFDNPPNSLDQSLSDNRAKHDSSKMDVKPEIVASPSRHGERTESHSPEYRVARDIERKDHRTDRDKVDPQKTPRKNDNRRNDKPLERRPEPDSWRKPVEQAKSEIPSPRHGKTASALELTQVFSRSASETRIDSRLNNQSSIPGRNQVPFSRLLDSRELHSGPNPRKINGY